ncbi:hypothetical protein ACH5RR_032196 [Cinchona calisaya]|uniref:Uncharacterized protein n=1 Tax=Cinchona calisaya TaxID=153742 RepID=A0ABD2YLH9_9GENT
MDSLLESLLALSDSSAFSLDLSFDRLLDSLASNSDKSDLIDRALNLGSVLLEAAKRSARKRASMHNALVWPLAPDLTIKHEIVPIENITVIDSRCGEKFSVHKAGSYDLITQQFDACASWWTHGT